MHIDDNQREFSHHGQSQTLALECQTRARGGGNGEATGKRGTYCGANAANLVFHLNGLHAHVAALGEFVQNVGGGSDGVAAQEQGATALFRGENQTPSGGLVAVHVGVDARLELVGLNAVVRYRGVNIVSVVVAAANHLGIGFVDFGFLFKLALQIAQRCAHGQVEQPAHQAQRKHVAALHL